MFIDHSRSLPDMPPAPPAPTPTPINTNRTLLLAAGIALVIAIIGGGVWWYVAKRNSQPETPPTTTETTPTGLPETLEPAGDGSNSGSLDESDRRGETVVFGALYQSLASEPLDIKPQGVSLPLNVKSEVSNYYEVSRKINLDSAVTKLNRDGFAVIDSPFGEAGRDFFSAYAELNRRGVPSLVTSDFVLYYYQNSIKRIYQDVQASYFYDSLWKVNKQLFDAANGRYQERRQKVGVANDPLLEAERLEAGYFATALSLLSPESGQVNAAEELNDSRTFKPSEAKRYQFTPPSYLADDIVAEIALIKEGKKEAKSPLFLYSRSYADFAVPAGYGDNAKLRNFYLASRWQSSLFPLYYRDASCAGCLLDRDDWTINQVAAYLVAEDLSSSQALKNEWAKIYKVMSFFTGLRSDLTYLDYQAIRNEAFPKKSAEEIFAANAFGRLTEMRPKLEAKSFAAIAGGLSRTDARQKPLLGLRLLQTPYWPDRYIYDRLGSAVVGNHERPRNSRGDVAQYLTACVNSKDRSLYRCRGIGFDILGIAAPLSADGQYLTDNTDYTHYDAERSKLAKEVAGLDIVPRRSNNFWTTLDIVKAYVTEKFQALPYTGLKSWRERQVTSGLAGLTSLSLPADDWEAVRSANSNLETSQSTLMYTYLEPTKSLGDELVADTSMLFKALVGLGVVKDNDDRFTELSKTLSSLRTIGRAELSGAPLSPSDYQFLGDLLGRYRVITSGGSSATVPFYDATSDRTLTVKQSVSPLKLLVLVYEKDGKKILAVGPVFSYKEE